MSALQISQFILSGLIVFAFAFLALLYGALARIVLQDGRRKEATAIGFGAIIFLAVGVYVGWGILQ